MREKNVESRFFSNTGAVVRKRSVEKVPIKTLQNSQETTCASFFYNKVTSLEPAT